MVGLFPRSCGPTNAKMRVEPQAAPYRPDTPILALADWLGDEVEPATVTAPSGASREVELEQAEPGLFRAEIETEEVGLFEIANGDLTALAHVGAVDSPEFRATVSTTEVLTPLAAETGGRVARLSDEEGNLSLPTILPVRGAVRDAGEGRLPLRITDESVLTGVNRYPLFAGFLGLAVLLMAFGSMWYREGR